MSANGTAIIATPKAAPSLTPASVSILTPEGYRAAMSLSETLVQSGFLPRAITKPAQALAIILAGQELGLPPMKALREIHIIEGKPTLSAELMLSMFKRRGGHAKWIASTDTIATLWLQHPNGDEHTESFSMDDAKRAGVAGKDNWRKYPKAMLKARVISAAIRALGEADGLYDPDEMGAVTAPAVAAEYSPPTPHDPTTGEVLPVSMEVAVASGSALPEVVEADVASRCTHPQIEKLKQRCGWLGIDLVEWLLARNDIDNPELLSKEVCDDAIDELDRDVAKLMPHDPNTISQRRKFYAIARTHFPGPGGTYDTGRLKAWVLAQHALHTIKFCSVGEMGKIIESLERGDGIIEG